MHSPIRNDVVLHRQRHFACSYSDLYARDRDLGYLHSKKGLVGQGSRVVLFTTSACKTTNWLHGWQPERERQINHSLGDGLPNKEMWASIKSR